MVSPAVVLRVAGLSKRYGRDLRVDGLDLEVFDGDVYGFLGPNGAGKSTTIRMILGLVRPTAGHVDLLGARVRPGRAVSGVGALVEGPALYPHLSGRKNVEIFAALSADVPQKSIAEAMEIVGLSGRADDPVRVYSHGMRQRCALAQALVPRPRLLILDEPTNGLDPEGIREMRALILRLRGELGITVFLSSHQLSEVEKICSRLAVIHLGRKLFEGSLADLRRLHALAGFRVLVDHAARDQARAALAARGLAVEPDPGPAAAPADHAGNGAALVVWADAARVPDAARALLDADLPLRGIAPVGAELEDLFVRLIAAHREPGHLRGVAPPAAGEP